MFDPAPITPAPIPLDAPTILLFGGTFDPPHAAHAILPVQVRDTMLGPGAWLLYVPTAQNPLKTAGPQAPEHDRLAMLRILVQGVDGRASIWTDELDRARPTDTPT